MKRFIASNTVPLAAASLLILAAGCGRDSVKVYKVETNDTTVTLPPAQGSMGMPSSMPAGVPAMDKTGLPALKYTLPDGWQEKPPTELRVASFVISGEGKQADVSVTPLGGMAGGDFANVNRWRGQVGLQPLTEDELQKTAEKVEAAGQPADLYDIAGTSPGSGDVERIIAVILHRDDMAWFFKLTGNADVAEKNKAAFVGFLKSVSFGEPAAPAAAGGMMDMSQLPPSHPAIEGMSLGSQNSLIPNANTVVTGGIDSDGSGKPTWTIPAGWQEGPLAQFLVAKYVITGTGDARAEVNASSLSGDGGGLLANINRWRGQLGQTPATEADLANLPTIDASGTKATVVEITGTNPRTGKPAQLIGVILPLDGQTWFYKLMGDAGVVAQQKDALVKFVQSAKYPAAQ
jgi:hypothetical protein